MPISHAGINTSTNTQMEEFNTIDSWDLDAIINWIIFVKDREDFLIEDWLDKEQIIEAFSEKWYTFQDKELPISEKVINTFLGALQQNEYTIRDYIGITITDWLAIDYEMRKLKFIDLEKDITAWMAWLNDFLGSNFLLDYHTISKIRKIFEEQGFNLGKKEPVSIKKSDIKRSLDEFMNMLKTQLKIQQDRRKFSERTEALVRYYTK